MPNVLSCNEEDVSSAFGSLELSYNYKHSYINYNCNEEYSS